MSDNKQIAGLIIDFLKSSVKDNSISEDYIDSMDVAIDCIADAFEIDKDEELKGKSLKDLLKGGSNVSETKAESVTVDESDKVKADEFKLEGNRAMAARDFATAIDKYTKAIELNPQNVVYLSNRAAAFSSNGQHDKAIVDAESAIKLDSSFSKSYSRLGLAKYALGDAKSAMEAYKKGLDIEGDKRSDAMARGYETAKKRYEEELEKSIPKSDVATSEKSTEGTSANAGSGAGAGGLPDFSSMFGGGGMPDLASMMNNPQIMQAAQQMMQNPEALQGLMNNPMLKNMAQNMGLGGENGQMPDMSELMNNPMLKNMANQFMNNQGNNGDNN
ncbi:small glutamine-rich tetratricopeptide repeat-containing protein 2 [[Candida] jaroonii]|uniref:Small glutamine-rich tetratricopeptide repeat-containing protein 2 n=1 Tax=[Candida] jaroonii TaxID=467808 RepID=A0ACA9YBQ3_9ASCO|nr:small glutamine-rich tetratricopeptide repeat-containing protein 2 [[Candida] jaroonii]